MHSKTIELPAQDFTYSQTGLDQKPIQFFFHYDLNMNIARLNKV